MKISLWLSLLLASNAYANTHAPHYQVGDTFIFDNNRVEQLQQVEGDQLAWNNHNGSTSWRSRHFFIPLLRLGNSKRYSQRTIVGNPHLLWPLQAGKQQYFQVWSKLHDETKAEPQYQLHFWQCHVLKTSTISVPAGRFVSYPIECDRYSPNTMEPLLRIRWYYAPAVGHYIKRHSHNLLTGEQHHFSLYASLPSEQANPRRIANLRQKISSEGNK